MDIILLNGPSTSGKTSIQREVQKRADYLKVGIDQFFDELIVEPDIAEEVIRQYTHSGELIRSIETKHDGEHRIVTLEVGPAGDRIIHGMHRALAAYAEAGNQLIVDYILYKENWLPDLQKCLEPFDVLYVKVDAPLHILEEREKSRKTSPPGHARSHYNTVHANMNYALELDTSKLSPQECAERILSSHPEMGND